MTWGELERLITLLPRCSKLRQHATAKINLRHGFLKHNKSLVVSNNAVGVYTTNDDPLPDNLHFSQQPGRFPPNPSTTPIGTPPLTVDGLPQYLLPPLPPPTFGLNSYLDMAPSTLKQTPSQTQSGTTPFEESERLIHEALPTWEAYKLADYASWHPPLATPGKYHLLQELRVRKTMWYHQTTTRTSLETTPNSWQNKLGYQLITFLQPWDILIFSRTKEDKINSIHANLRRDSLQSSCPAVFRGKLRGGELHTGCVLVMISLFVTSLTVSLNQRERKLWTRKNSKLAQHTKHAPPTLVTR
jgi:hypothetical protein